MTMNQEKKPRTSLLYSDQLTKHWSNCSAGFEVLPKAKRAGDSAKESQNKKLKYEEWGEDDNKDEKEIDIIWSSSSEDEKEITQDIKAIRTKSNIHGKVSQQTIKSNRTTIFRQQKNRSTFHGKVPESFQNSFTLSEDARLEDCIVSDSESDADAGGCHRNSSTHSQKDGLPQRTDEGLRQEKHSSPSTLAERSKSGLSSHFVQRGKMQYIHAKRQESFEPEILDYDSTSEDESPAVSETISVPSSTSQSPRSRAHQDSTLPSPMTISMAGSPKTGSDWVKKLKLQASITPERRPTGGEEPTRGVGPAGAGANIVDSARKKKKFVSSGLAERLQKLISREKSSMAMWNHNQADSQNSQESTKPGLVVKVLSCEIHRGLYVTRCLTQVSAGSKVDDGGDKAGCSQDEMYVLFTRSTGEQLGLAIDVLVSIHTPWQKLSIPEVSKPVVLCTHFCRRLNLEPTDQAQSQMVLHECRIENSRLPKVFNPLRLFPGTSGNQSPHVKDGAHTENGMKNISSSIMESVSGTGACSSLGVSFKATIQRIVTRRHQTVIPHQSSRGTLNRQSLQLQSSPYLIKSLLLQDRESVVCELQLTNQMAESTTWQPVLQSGEGSSYIFMNLRVTQRLTLARSPGLLSIIRSLQQHPPNVSGQTVCYILTSEDGVSAVEPLDRSEHSDVPSFSSPSAVDLCEVIKSMQMPTRRISFKATPILISPAALDNSLPSYNPTHTTDTPKSWFLFLSTSSNPHYKSILPSRESNPSLKQQAVPDQYMRLHVHQSNVLGEEVLMNLMSSGNRDRVVCRDILASSNDESVFLNADGFSQIILENEPVPGRKYLPKLTLPLLKVDTRLHSLITIEGNICGIEEESAFSWPACPRCGNNHLDGGESSGSILHCSECKKDVISPTIRMHLIIILTCPSMPSQCTVKVQLLQQTIESVLPAPSSQTSSGHDLQSILGVLVGPINCLVRTVSETPERKVFLLEEVSLCN